MADHISEYELKLFAEATIANQIASKHFGIAIGGLMGLFIITHWTQKLSQGLVSKGSAIHRFGSPITRPFRRAETGAAIGGVLVLPTQILLAAAYLGINLALTFTNVNWTQQTLFAKRLGWLVVLISVDRSLWD